VGEPAAIAGIVRKVFNSDLELVDGLPKQGLVGDPSSPVRACDSAAHRAQVGSLGRDMGTPRLQPVSGGHRNQRWHAQKAMIRLLGSTNGEISRLSGVASVSAGAEPRKIVPAIAAASWSWNRLVHGRRSGPSGER
jgi:hypothetical protein